VLQVTPERLAELNVESAALIAKWGIEVATSEELGGYLRSTTGIPAGQLALLLPPNLIQSFSEVTNYNAVIQVRFHEQQSERLYSASLTPEDLDNFLSHSCDPHCVLDVDQELTVRVTCSRAIPPLEPISIDYERASLRQRHSCARGARVFAHLTHRHRAGGGHGGAGRGVRLRMRDRFVPREDCRHTQTRDGGCRCARELSAVMQVRTGAAPQRPPVASTHRSARARHPPPAGSLS
jgi:SET domain